MGFISTIFLYIINIFFCFLLTNWLAWSAMLVLPFTILTNALSGKIWVAYLGLFNGTICLPQIVALTLGGVIYKYVTNESSIYMLPSCGYSLSFWSF